METHSNNNKKSSNNLIVMKKVRRLLPSSFSSCQFRSLPDVAESSITITTKSSSASQNINNINSSKKPSPLLPHRHHSSNGRKCAPTLTTVKKMEMMGKLGGGVNHSSSSHSGLFTSSDDKTRAGDHDFSLSSNSGDSFRLKSSRRFSRRCHDMMKSIVEEVKIKPTKNTTSPPESELVGSDHIFTQLYYQNSKSNLRRRKVRRKIKKSGTSKVGPAGPMIEGSYAVEKSSGDPWGDFRASMVEMIVAKQLFGSEDLERLLLCFLSLNAVSYHGIIYHVFSDICQTLFANS